MALQYNLPLTTKPLVDLADQLGRNPDDVIKEVRGYIATGIVKRYGLNLNYRAFPNYRRAALVGFRAENVERVARRINAYDEFRVKHNFLRDAYYNVWFTVKGRDLDEISAIVGRIAGECEVDEYVVLPTKRVYKMDVKYDLIKGVSWSNRGLEPESVPLVKNLGFEDEFVRSLESLDATERPFAKFNRSEEEVVDAVHELMRKGVGRDFSGVLRERKVGFRENGMTVLKLSTKPEEVAMQLLNDFPQITHLIERIVSEKWNYPIYFMVHAVKRETIEEIREQVLQLRGVEEAKTIYSRANLRET
uniref:Lrp/AsnC family transcriptional regulator n=1 Tax=Archaeoglobus fulgidus TaxID=2234 RepID=A0A7C3RD20_ARCFL